MVQGLMNISCRAVAQKTRRGNRGVNKSPFLRLTPVLPAFIPIHEPCNVRGMASSGVLAHRLRLLRIIAEREKRAKVHNPTLPAPPQEWFNEQQRRTIRQAMDLGLVADTDGVRLTGAGKRFLDIFDTKRRRTTPVA
jgi:hypothetical protein